MILAQCPYRDHTHEAATWDQADAEIEECRQRVCPASEGQPLPCELPTIVYRED